MCNNKLSILYQDFTLQTRYSSTLGSRGFSPWLRLAPSWRSFWPQLTESERPLAARVQHQWLKKNQKDYHRLISSSNPTFILTPLPLDGHTFLASSILIAFFSQSQCLLLLLEVSAKCQHIILSTQLNLMPDSVHITCIEQQWRVVCIHMFLVLEGTFFSAR